jgi:hypothetical protein
MKIQQLRFPVFFLVMLVLPAGFSYLAGFDTHLDYFFFVRAFSIAFCLTVFYYLMLKNKAGKIK